MSFTIIKNAGPPPERRYGPERAFPLADLDVGDAFDIPHSGDRYPSGNLKEQTRAAVACRRYRSRHPEKKFVTRTIGDVVRVYRVA